VICGLKILQAQWSSRFRQIRLGILCAFSAVSSFSFGQLVGRERLLILLDSASTDSARVHSHIALAKWNLDGDFPEAAAHAEKAVTASILSGIDELIASAHTSHALTHWHNGEYDKSVDSYNRSLAIQKRIGNADAMGINYHGIAMNHYYRANYPDAITFHHHALREFQKAGNKSRESLTLNHLGLVYHKMGNFPQAIHYLYESTRIRKNLDGYLGRTNSFSGMSPFLRSEEFYREELKFQRISFDDFIQQGDEESVLQTLYNLGRIYVELNYPDSAILSCRQAIAKASQIGKRPDYYLLGTAYLKAGMIDSGIQAHRRGLEISKARGTQIGILNGNTLLGDALFAANRKEEALRSYRTGLEMTRAMGNQLDVVMGLQRVANVLMSMGQVNDAGQVCRESIELARRLGTKNQLRDGYSLMAELNGNSGHFSEAYHYHQQWKSLNDSIIAGEADLQFAQMHAQFELDRKNEDIRLLSQEKLIQQEKLRNKDILILGSILGIALTSLLALSIFLMFRQKARDNKVLLEQKGQIEMLLAEIHHRVKNSLQVISSLINLKARHATSDTSEALMQLNGRIYSMSLVHEKLYMNENLVPIKLDEYLTDVSRHLITTFEDKENPILLDLDCHPVTVDAETVLTCGLITNELVANAVKYAFGSHQQDRKVSIKLRQEQRSVFLRISDNGQSNKPIAIDFKKSFGLRFVDQLVKSKLKGDWKLATDSAGCGVLVSIHFSTGLNLN
jgi:two-component sensor histidine kinase